MKGISGPWGHNYSCFAKPGPQIDFLNECVKWWDKWLKNKNAKFIISADYDGLICASFLSHVLDWKLVGYYNMEKIWISDEGIKNRTDIIWVDLNILSQNGKSIGGHITMIDDVIPDGFTTSCNPNIIAKIKNFKLKCS